MKKFIRFILWLFIALGVTYAGYTVFDSLTVHWVSQFGNTIDIATIDGSGILTFTWPNAWFAEPHIMVSDTTSQTIANVNTWQVITYNTVDDAAYWMSLSWTSMIKVPRNWDYLFIISAIADVWTNGKKVWIWARKNWVDVTWSNSELILQANSTAIISVPFLFDMNAWDYIQFVFGTNDAAWRLYYIASGTNPVRPSTPSIIVTAKRISNS